MQLTSHAGVPSVNRQGALDLVEISVLVPFYNEEGNVEALYKELKLVLDGIGCSYEMIFVNDGSRDGTAAILDSVAERDQSAKVIHLLRNYGQTAAIMAAINYSSGKLLVGLDGDGQNDPRDIPAMIAELDKGFDVVSGWRRDRQDRAISRRLPSRIANSIISRVSGVRLHDYGCSLKVYRRDVIKGVRLYGDMHRFIPIYTKWLGGRVTEMAVNHRPRVSGESKYGLDRTFKVLLDLTLVVFLERYLTKPLHFFGGIGVVSVCFSLLSGILAIYLRLVEGVSFILTPLPLLTVMLFMIGVLMILMGIQAEMLIRGYFESQGKSVYIIKDMRNLSGTQQ